MSTLHGRAGERPAGISAAIRNAVFTAVLALAALPPVAHGSEAATVELTPASVSDGPAPAVRVVPDGIATIAFADRSGAPLRIVWIEGSGVAAELAPSHPHVAILRAGDGRRGGTVVALLEGVDRPVHVTASPRATATQLEVRVAAVRPERARPAAGAGEAGAAVRDRAAVEAVVREYLLANPGIIEEATDPRRRLAGRVSELRAEVIGDLDVPSTGAPMDAAAVTVVEFFDYRCGFCKRSLDAVRAAAALPDVRVELRDYPILGPDSVRASRLALAAGMQASYADAHFALMAREDDYGDAAAAELASALGLDADRLRSDMDSAAVSARIEANTALARRLGVTGTPAFLVVGPEQVRASPGSLDASALSALVDEVR